MKVPPSAGTLQVVPIEERTFDQHSTAVAYEIQIQKPTERRITRIGDERNLDRIFNGHACFLQRYQFGAGLTAELGFQLVSRFYQRVAQRAGRMVDLERAYKKSPSQRHVLKRLDADYFSGRVMAFNVPPNVHEPLDRLCETAMNDHATRRVSNKVSLREIISNSCGVIHVTMGQAHVIDGDNLAGRTPNVEANIMLRGGNDGFLTRQRESDQGDTRKFFLDQSAHTLFIRQNRSGRPVGVHGSHRARDQKRLPFGDQMNGGE